MANLNEDGGAMPERAAFADTLRRGLRAARRGRSWDAFDETVTVALVAGGCPIAEAYAIRGQPALCLAVHCETQAALSAAKAWLVRTGCCVLDGEDGDAEHGYCALLTVEDLAVTTHA